MEPYMGEIRMFAGTYAPQGWLTCDGQILPISRYSTLFSLLGTVYGGDGMQTFALPDLRSRTPIHVGQGRGLSQYYPGSIAGQEQVTLSQAQMPSHSHQMLTIAAGANQISPENNYLAIGIADGTGNAESNYQDFSDTTLPQTYLNGKTVVPSGGNQPFNVVSPVLGVTFIIAIEGIYPPRP
ncbi:phage tail protein [Mucilaginibacter pedocola]|uniref:Phage tail collar domain-containing protein n=1 Tax=Mucilaginibacter pedocola TaxID=1792845 RepID=A0A1S9PG74_9SPHI|nr:tail fiber protein [Mucilaginibacter pedocola]OOQ59964.1 hypothetical protein BC343_27825 [Mucilaginibacter pedocola]